MLGNDLFPSFCPCCLDLLRPTELTTDWEDSRPFCVDSSAVAGLAGGLAIKFTVITG